MTQLDVLEAYLAETETALVQGHPTRSHEELRYVRTQTLRRIAMIRQDDAARVIAEQQHITQLETPADGS
jgi:hypothetical protein